jgi:5-methyltetrahydrofolate--homocysteine methyltransferase
MRKTTLETLLRGRGGKTVTIGGNRPTVVIGERINPTGKKRLAASLQEGSMEIVLREATSQIEAGADVIDVNVGAAGVDEVALLPQAVRTVAEAVDAPICIDSANVQALEAALKELRSIEPDARPLINSVNGEEASLDRVLPLVKEYDTAVIALAMDDDGIPPTAEQRLAVVRKIIDRAEGLGIARADIVVDSLSLTVGADSAAALVTLGAIETVNQEFQVNQTLGASNVSFGLPERELLTGASLAISIAAGLTSAIVDAAKVQPFILAADLLMGTDDYGMRYIKGFRQRRQA